MEPRNLTGVTLDKLVAGLEAAHPDVRDRIGDAMLIAEHLDQVGDELIEHVVLTARSEGISWSEIGTRMGVSKQAAQQRLAKSAAADLPPLSPEQGFSRFTVEARNLLVAAHEAARVRREPHLTVARLAVTVGVESAADRLPVPGEEELSLVPYDDDAKAALARSFELAITAGADMVEVAHVTEAVEAGLAG